MNSWLRKTIFTGFEPNLSWRHVSISFIYLFFPWKWYALCEGEYVIRAEKKLQEYFSVSHVSVFDSGRSALYIALRAQGVQKGDEVLVQAYTCVVVINAIIYTGATPVFVDVQNDCNIDIKDLKKKITKKTKAIIIQHTFGLPADVDGICAVAKKHNIQTIEDCAHSLGAVHKKRLTGTIADIGMLSFGSDKIISCGRGGALVTKDSELAKKITFLQKNLPKAPIFSIVQQLLKYTLFAVAKPLYSVEVGKMLLFITKKLDITGSIIDQKEKRGERVSGFPSVLPNVFARILCHQIGKIDTLNSHRKKIAKLYTSLLQKDIQQPQKNSYESVYLRYLLFVKNPVKLHALAKKHRIILGSWYDSVISPRDVDMEKSGYKKGMCPNAEKYAAQSINLPTHKNITKKEVKRIVTLLNTL
ncbi:MAG: hypothetical protein CL685_02905 [Candidatus Magasanikbacteria bacterium]|nr:hypothetical protein [Candidatus Magasanikbacteria bacterium]|tara:strand:- start:4611 stop:5858 length:1248 start_codon:yes stop_codon:yes gene_type:complete